MSLSVFQAAREAPEQPALIFEAETLSYARVAALAAFALGWLGERGVSPTQAPPPVVCLTASTTPESIAMAYALMSVGVPFLPLHPDLGPQERQAALTDCGCSIVVDEQWHLSAARRPGAPEPSSPPDDERWLAVAYTSGSSGAAKGVALSRRAFRASAAASATNLGWKAHDRWLLCLPFCHVGGLSVLTRSLYARRPVVVAPARSGPDRLFGILETRSVTLASFVPTQLLRGFAERPSWRPPQTLRAVLVGGAACSPALAEQARERRLPMLCTYGLTEACSQVATQRYGAQGVGVEDCGPPLPGIEVDCPGGIIHVRGPNLFSAYVTGERREPHAPTQWFCTGDRGKLDEQGRLHVFGRADEVIITGGENVSPAFVERVLESLPGVTAACVVGVADPVWGQIVAATLVLDRSQGNKLEEIVRQAEARLSRFMRPRRWLVVEALPENSTGKVDRDAVAQKVQRFGACHPHMPSSQ